MQSKCTSQRYKKRNDVNLKKVSFAVVENQQKQNVQETMHFLSLVTEHAVLILHHLSSTLNGIMDMVDAPIDSRLVQHLLIELEELRVRHTRRVGQLLAVMILQVTSTTSRWRHDVRVTSGYNTMII